MEKYFFAFLVNWDTNKQQTMFFFKQTSFIFMSLYQTVELAFYGKSAFSTIIIDFMHQTEIKYIFIHISFMENERYIKPHIFIKMNKL